MYWISFPRSFRLDEDDLVCFVDADDAKFLDKLFARLSIDELRDWSRGMLRFEVELAFCDVNM